MLISQKSLTQGSFHEANSFLKSGGGGEICCFLKFDATNTECYGHSQVLTSILTNEMQILNIDVFATQLDIPGKKYLKILAVGWWYLDILSKKVIFLCDLQYISQATYC
jgi:hypothetical protein